MPEAINRRSVLKGAATAGAIAASGLLAACDGAGRPLDASAKQDLDNVVTGKVYWRGDAAYETARGATAYRMNKPKRYPQVIVQAAGADDVVAAVRFAGAHGLKVTTRSGGHSWSSAHIRDNCLLVDLSRMQQVDVDPASQTVWTNPGVIGSHLNTLLEPHGFIVPTAHHPSPGIGGFCMNGGFGWNSRLWGNGARHVLAIDVVTADGRLIRADAHQNQDYWWAARGGGAGFFGVITRMQLRCRPLPKVWKGSAFGWDDATEVFDQLMAWAIDLVPRIPPYMEFVMTTTANSRDTGEPVKTRMSMAALALTDDEALADAALDLLKTCPVIDQATFRVDKAPTNLEERYQSGFKADPAGFRFAADNMYTDRPVSTLVPRLRRVFLDLPTPHTHSFFFAWGPIKPLPDDMALSMQGPVYIATYTLWTDPAKDDEMERWPPDRMKELADLSLGGQLNDENMLHHPQRYFTPAAYTKLERLRSQLDPERRFEGFMGSPMPS